MNKFTMADRNVILNELSGNLGVFFNIPSKDTKRLLSELLMGLEAEGRMLKKHSAQPINQYFRYSLDSITLVAHKLKSRILLDCVTKLHACVRLSEEQRNEVLDDFIDLIETLRDD